MTHQPTQPSRADGQPSRPAGDRPDRGKIPKRPDDTTAGGDAKNDIGEDNHSAKKGEQSAEDFIRR